jgi:CP family cyanate transporter-like MFS transporter
MHLPSPRGSRPLQQALPALCLLGLAGLASRIPILAAPPIIPSLHDDFQLNETQVGALIGLPLALFALAAVPGSLLVARLGARTTLLVGLTTAAVASALRGAAINVWWLYAATIVMGAGVAVMQPALPRLVRDWLPDRLGLGTAAYTNGMIAGATIAVAFTPTVMSQFGNNWRLDLAAWSALVLLVTIVLAWKVPAPVATKTAAAMRWRPNWASPLPWILGLAFAGNNSMYFAINAVLPDYLTSTGRAEFIATALLWLNLSQIVGLLVLTWAAERMLHRAWPYLVFGSGTLVGVVGLAFLDGQWIAFSAFLIGLGSSITLGTVLALPPALSAPDEVHLTAAGMLTVAYAVALVVPIICGALWDATGIAQIAFVPIGFCSLALIVFGVIATRLRAPRPASVRPAVHLG